MQLDQIGSLGERAIFNRFSEEHLLLRFKLQLRCVLLEQLFVLFDFRCGNGNVRMGLVENFLSSWIAFGLFILALLLLAVLVMLLIIVLLRLSDTFVLFVHGGCGGRIRRLNWQSRLFSLLRRDLHFVPTGATRGLPAAALLLLLLLLL